MSSATFSWGSSTTPAYGSPQSTTPTANSGPNSPIPSLFSGDGDENITNNVVDGQVEESLWFYDGTVVFQAGSMLFKLHSSILGSRSTVLDNFLNWGQVSQSSGVTFLDGGVFEGNPVIKLADDGQDAKYFFLAIYDSRFFERPPAQTSYEVVLAILKLSTKYEVDYLRKRALAHLSLSYPFTLEQWDRREKVSTLSAELDVDAWPGPTSKTLKVIEAAKKLDVPWILPAAFYECSTVNLELLLSNSQWDDGTIDSTTKNSILIGYHKQSHATQSKMLQFLYCDPLERCATPNVCGELRRQVYCDARDWTVTKPLSIMVDEDWGYFLGDLCGLCLEVSRVRFEKARKEFWDKLPEIYGLPGWEVLVEMYEEALGDQVVNLRD